MVCSSSKLPCFLYLFSKSKEVGEYYPALKSNEILVHPTTWMNLANIMPSEISQPEKNKYCMIPHIWGTQSS